MIDTTDDELWRLYIKTVETSNVYIGTHVTGGQWAYLACNGDDHYLVFTQRWFKRVIVTPYQPTDVSQWD